MKSIFFDIDKLRNVRVQGRFLFKATHATPLTFMPQKSIPLHILINDGAATLEQGWGRLCEGNIKPASNRLRLTEVSLGQNDYMKYQACFQQRLSEVSLGQND